ncbi:TetR family transcriptional regulator [Streptomyces sp. NPDC005438]|uniref:TetR family transcriptional regulator n=1 Tax=Streptomyces sp. NPDC005438 TaxID=3156880 RepID=UPI0033BF6E96
MKKERTREALLDAALALLEEQSLSSLGLREVTRAVGISPAAFYRHFRDITELGIVLVQESLEGLHQLIGEVLVRQVDAVERIDESVDLIAAWVRAHPAHVRFLARERYGGVRAVRAEMAAQLDRFTDEVTAALRTEDESADWTEPELRMLAELYVDHMVITAAALLEADQGGGRDKEQVRETARSQLRLIDIGRVHYRQHREPR